MNPAGTVKALARRTAEPALDVARRRLGRRIVNWTPEFMGFGNQLYLWAWAHAHRDEQPSPRVLVIDKMRYWVPHFPAVRPWLVEPTDVGVLDQRAHLWADPVAHAGDRRGYTDASRAAFIADWLLSAPALSSVRDSELATGDVLTVNVRRGDYYSNPHHRPEFAIDLAAYLRLAVEGALESDGAVRRIHVVSDDVAWCRRRLPWLRDMAPDVTFPAAEDGPIDNFRDVCSSRRLVISNSTFSIWGAAVAATALGSTSVWAPAFFQQRYGPGRCYEYDQQWSFVDDLPGGWQPDWVLAGEDHPAADVG
ncbi:hypothetical protein HN031_04325 [Nocardioides sp. zg-1308]|uniref:alpha-1,2-fucosyltransferase n=1 Tax=Nocardioides TaxID=1839 RepID=UPI0015558821|nr:MULTISPECIES: alpha-1,2-fucosyltransferase [unclassified Nocardioides]NPD03910.1 hypothetical protein [Nocardioides sp. zg-1308]WQQ21788.1 alpha-1,2-fucosyltransferase [Nocardioides sp. S-34]